MRVVLKANENNLPVAKKLCNAGLALATIALVPGIMYTKKNDATYAIAALIIDGVAMNLAGLGWGLAHDLDVFEP